MVAVPDTTILTYNLLQEQGLSGVSSTASQGAISPTEMTIGLTGQSATVTLGQVGGPIAWEKLVPSQGGSWSKKTPTQGGSWSKKSA